jgi:metal-responsive CopG/Arc/MetJ family transcriptional regulator
MNMKALHVRTREGVMLRLFVQPQMMSDIDAAADALYLDRSKFVRQAISAFIAKRNSNLRRQLGPSRVSPTQEPAATLS